jgi:hypothetical protein
VSKVLERLKKKRGSPVQIGDETYHVRTMTIGESRRMDRMVAALQRPDDKHPEERTGFMLGCCVCNDTNGEQAIPKGADETDAQWAVRVLDEFSDVPTETTTALLTGIANIGKPASLDTIIKN